eukprot:3380121-Heterocapsa_arctica.AAC.1
MALPCGPLDPKTTSSSSVQRPETDHDYTSPEQVIYTSTSWTSQPEAAVIHPGLGPCMQNWSVCSGTAGPSAYCD